MLTQLELHQRVSYDPRTGLFTYLERVSQRQTIGDPAGFVDNKGYVRMKIAGQSYGAHRLAWLYMTGEWPEFQIDHVNRDRKDNRFDNLRPATSKQQSENRNARAGSASGFRGVSWSNGKWTASIMHFGKQISLGHFPDLSDAKAARLEAEEKLFTHSNRAT